MNDLIEQLETLNNYYALHPGKREQETADVIVETIAALSPSPPIDVRINGIQYDYERTGDLISITLPPVLPEEVQEYIEKCGWVSDMLKAGEQNNLALLEAGIIVDRLADLIERLAMSVENWRDICELRQQRIEELTAPVLPEEVRKKCRQLSQLGTTAISPENREICDGSIDLIERLAQQYAEEKSRNEIIETSMDAYRQRIETEKIIKKLGKARSGK